MSVMDRFNELYRWDLGSRSGDFTRIRVGGRFITLGSSLENQPFGIRLLVSGIWTTCLFVYEERQGRFKIDRLATPYEDKELRQDAFLELEGPIQYKIREDRVDYPCVRFQPCYGLSDARTEDGRDYKGLRDHTTNYNYAAIWSNGGFEKIHRVDSQEFWEKVEQLEQDWGHRELPLYGNWSREDGAQVWHQKKESNYTKYNFYIPPRLFTTLETKEISSDHSSQLNKFYRAAWNKVVNDHIL